MNDYRYLYQPREVSIETMTVCNAACSFCPYPGLERKGTKMDFGLLMTLIKQMAEFEHPFYLSPFKVNEPFLDKRLIGVLVHINRTVPLASLRLFTNGTTLTDANIIQIAGLERVAHLWVSLNSTDPDDYYRLMQLDYERTAVRLDVLHHAMVDGHFKHTVVVSRVMQGDVGANDQDRQFADACKRRWPRFLVQMIKRDGWLGFVDPQFSQVPNTPCSRWWELSIMADGKVALCCMDGKGEYVLGDTHHTSLLDIYNTPELLRRRLGLEKRTRVVPCNRCTY